MLIHVLALISLSVSAEGTRQWVTTGRFSQAVQSRLLADINGACGNPSTHRVFQDFQCRQGGEVRLRELTARYTNRVNRAIEALMRELPVPARAHLTRQCSRETLRAGATDTDVFQCWSEQVASLPADLTRGPPRWNQAMAQRRARAIVEASRQRGAIIFACEASQGHVSGDTITARDPQCHPAFAVRDAGYRPSREESRRPASGSGASSGGREGGDSISAFFDASSSIGANPVECPDFIPRRFCGGSEYDPRHYREVRETVREVAGATGARTGQVTERAVTRMRYDEQQSFDLGGQDIGQVMDGVYSAVRGHFVADMRGYLARLYIERYLTQAALANSGSSFDDRLNELRTMVNTQSCLRSEAGFMDTMINHVSRHRSRGAEVYENQSVNAAHCAAAVTNRWMALRQQLGMTGTQVRPLITEESIRDLRISGTDSVPFVSSLAQAGVSGVSSLPVIRQLTREMPTLMRSSASASAECSFERIQTDASTSPVSGRTRIQYCTDLYDEYSVVSQEVSSLYSAYAPLFTARAPGQPVGYQRFISAHDLDPRVRSYSGNGRSCMELMAEHQASDAERATVRQINNTDGRAQLSAYLQGLRQLCRNPEGEVANAVRDPSLMANYFNCDRLRMNELRVFLGAGVSGWPREDQAGQSCSERMDSAWVACRFFRDGERSGAQWETAGQGFALGMDLISLGTGFSGAIGVSASGALVGAGIGGGLAYMMSPSQDELVQGAEGRRGVAALTGDVQGFERASRELQNLRAADPQLAAVVDAAIQGAASGLFSGANPSSGRGWLRVHEALRDYHPTNPGIARRLRALREEIVTRIGSRIASQSEHPYRRGAPEVTPRQVLTNLRRLEASGQSGLVDAYAANLRETLSSRYGSSLRAARTVDDLAELAETEQSLVALERTRGGRDEARRLRQEIIDRFRECLE